MSCSSDTVVDGDGPIAVPEIPLLQCWIGVRGEGIEQQQRRRTPRAEAISPFHSWCPYWIVRQPQCSVAPLTKSGKYFEKWDSKVRCAIRTQTPNPKLRRPDLSLFTSTRLPIFNRTTHSAYLDRGRSTRPTVPPGLPRSPWSPPFPLTRRRRPGANETVELEQT
jgi:hypothetical protein